MTIYIHQYPGWPDFHWDQNKLFTLLSEVRFQQGKLLGGMESLGFNLQSEASLETLTLEVVKSSEIEGEILNAEQVRSSIARRLGMDVAGLVPSDRNVDGIVEMMLNATPSYQEKLTDERLFGWHSSLFPSGRSGMYKIVTGAWRNNTKQDPMQVVSGAIGREKVHFQAPDSELIGDEMERFLKWFNAPKTIDPVLKAGIAHLWFVTIHPFDDGNGRIARAITDMQLARADETAQRFYSMSAQIRLERNKYYSMLEASQKGTLDITELLEWFLQCLGRALAATDQILASVMRKSRLWNDPDAQSLNDRQKLMLNKLLENFEGKLTSAKWSKMAKCSQDTAVRDIQNLIEKGILMKEHAGGRSTSYVLKG